MLEFGTVGQWWLFGGRALQVGELRPHGHFYQRVQCRTSIRAVLVQQPHTSMCGHSHTHGAAMCATGKKPIRSHVLAVWVCGAPCLGATANSLRGVNFQQTQTSRKTFTKVNYSTKFKSIEGSELVRSLLLMRRDGETSESKADLLLLGSFNKT